MEFLLPDSNGKPARLFNFFRPTKSLKIGKVFRNLQSTKIQISDFRFDRKGKGKSGA